MKSIALSALSLLLVFATPSFLTAQEPTEEERAEQLARIVGQADYVFVGQIKSCEELGPGDPEDGQPTKLFFRFAVSWDQDVHGQYRERTRTAARDSGVDFPTDWTVNGLHATSQPKPEFLAEGNRCIVFLKAIKAGSMAGTIPVSILAFRPDNEETLEDIKQLVNERSGR